MLTAEDQPFPVEDTHIEYKSKLTERLKREICAFLNNNLVNHIKYSYVYLGVTDAKDTKGARLIPFSSSIRQKYEETINHWITTSFSPSSEARSNIKIYPNNNPFCIKVISNNTIFSTRISHHQNTYIRVGSSSEKASQSQILHMYYLSHRKHLDLDVSSNQKLTFNYTKMVFARNQKKHKHTDTQLRVNGISSFYTNSGKYTLTALLFSDQNPFRTNAAYYPPHNPSLNFQPHTLYGPIEKQVDDFMKYFSSRFNNLEYVFEGASPLRKDMRPYPSYAVREAVINMLAHRDYYNPDNPGSISIFNNRVVVDSPGSVPDNHHKKYILSHSSDAKNPEVLDMLHRLGYAENYGSGLPRIWGLYRKVGMKPAIGLYEDFVRISLPNIIVDKYGKHETTNQSKVSATVSITDMPISSKDKIILYLKHHKYINRSIIKDVCGVKDTQAKNLIRTLKHAKFIQKHGQSRGTYYTKNRK